MFDTSSRICCFVLAFACTREHAIMESAHTSLTSLKSLKTIFHQTKAPQKDLSRRHKSIRRAESESDWSVFVWALFWKLFRKRGETGSHKNRLVRSRFFSSSFLYVVSDLSYFFWFAGKIIFCVRLLGDQFSCRVVHCQYGSCWVPEQSRKCSLLGCFWCLSANIGNFCGRGSHLVNWRHLFES